MIYYAVVLYNKKIGDSITLNCLYDQIIDGKIIIIDNSTDLEIVNFNKNLKLKNAELISNGGHNLGLSISYNQILNFLSQKDLNKDDYICWLDDDTNIPSDFFSAQRKICNTSTFDVILPIVKGQDGNIYSPNVPGKIKNKKINIYDFSRDSRSSIINGINSCLTVKLNVYKNFFYDERLFLDQVDQLFFDLIRKKNLNYKILDTIIIQNFSQRDKQLNPSYKKRFVIRVKDLIVYGKISPYSNVLYTYIKNILLGLNFSRKTMSPLYFFYGITSIRFYFKEKW